MMAPAVRVASVPAAHPYVRHIGGAGVVRLPDPRPAGAAPRQWWPPVMLDAAWIGAHAGAFDLLHLHFGAESIARADLAAAVAALGRAERPLVFTVHDLQNPQLADQSAHLAQLDLLVPAADALVTLTQGAAAAIHRRWGRRAHVIPHPHVVPLDAELPVGDPRGERVVGLHLRDLRANVDGPGATRALLAAVAELRRDGCDVIARVELHETVRSEAGRDAVRRLCDGLSWVELRERQRPSDPELAAALADLDVSLLPYSHGTHSGWLELCWDLGVATVAPPVGHLAEQHRDPGTFASAAPGRLAPVLRELLARAPRPGSTARHALQRGRRSLRRRQRDGIAAAHLAVYRDLLREPRSRQGRPRAR